MVVVMVITVVEKVVVVGRGEGGVGFHCGT